MNWYESFLGIGQTLEEDLSALDQFAGFDEGPSEKQQRKDQEKADEKAMQKQLDAFLKEQKRLDEDGDFSKADRARARDDFATQMMDMATGNAPTKRKDIEDAIEGFFNFLEVSQRLVTEGGADTHVLTKDGTRNVWKAGGLPTGTASGQIVYWNDTTKAWVKSATPATKSIPVWTGTAWSFVAIGSAGFYLYNDDGDVVGGIPKLI